MSITYIAKNLNPESWKENVDWKSTSCRAGGQTSCDGGMENPRIGYSNGCGCSIGFHRNLCQRSMDNYKCELGMNLNDLQPNSKAREEIAKQVAPGKMSSINKSAVNCEVNKPKFNCTFDLPNPNSQDIILPEIPKALRMYNDNKGKFAVGDQYNDYMKQYCFSTVQTGAGNLCPAGETECPRYFQRASSPGGDAPRVECDLWSQMKPSEWDSRVLQYCNDPANIKKRECDCNASSTPGSNFYGARSAFAKVPGQGDECWFEPCRRQQTQFLTFAQKDTAKCKGIDCANITVIQDSTIDNTELNQVVDCSCKVENGSCGPPASKGGCQSDSECSNSVQCINNECGGGLPDPTPQPIENKCTGVICQSGFKCNPLTGLCVENQIIPVPQPSDDKCKGVVCINTTCDPTTGKCKDTPSSKNKLLISILVLVLVGLIFYSVFILLKKS